MTIKLTGECCDEPDGPCCPLTENCECIPYPCCGVECGECTLPPDCDWLNCEMWSEDMCSCEYACEASQECCMGECYEKDGCGEMGRNEEFCHCNECTKDSHCEGELVCCKAWGGCMEKEECDASRCQVWSSETCGCVSSCSDGQRCDVRAGGICRSDPDCKAIMEADPYVQSLMESCREANKTNTISTECTLSTGVYYYSWSGPCEGTDFYCAGGINYWCYIGHVRECTYSSALANMRFCPTFE